MGVYQWTEEIFNSFPVYRMMGSTNVIFVNEDGVWSINGGLLKFGFIFNFQSNPTPPVPPVSGWLYFDGIEFLPDNYLTVTAPGKKF